MYTKEYQKFYSDLEASMAMISGFSSDHKGEVAKIFSHLKIQGKGYLHILNNIDTPRYRHYFNPTSWKKLRNMIGEYNSLVEKAIEKYL